jgi:glycosyltransferase involved in cell wall biosynthesis
MSKNPLNIVGYPQGAFGIAEDSRSLKKIFDFIGVESRYLIPTFREIKPDVEIASEHFAQMNNGDINVFAISPMDMVGLALSQNRNYISNAGYAIGAWPWELPVWPEKFAKICNFVDEIWAQSSYVEGAFKGLGNIKIRRMPMLVSVERPNANVRKHFDIPENDFVFYSVLDGNSWISRKNPLASVKAFQKAFGNSSKGVSLVVKVMNIGQSGELWDEFATLAARDNRIIVINKILEKQDLINLISSCDCFISLHRSEGFGRNIAEAMLLGVPVITSNFSGNTDYCNNETSFLVGGEEVPLRPGDYLFHDSQYWFEADIGQAAQQMKIVIEQPEKVRGVIRNAFAYMEKNYSLKAVAPIYQNAIEEIMRL